MYTTHGTRHTTGAAYVNRGVPPVQAVLLGGTSGPPMDMRMGSASAHESGITGMLGVVPSTGVLSFRHLLLRAAGI
jgi:hypothetical protein